MKPLRTFSAVSFAVAALVSLGVRGAAQPTGSSETCFSYPLKGMKPLWISSAAWVEGRSEVGIVDPLQNKLLLVSPNGDVRPFNEGELQLSSKEFVPATFESTGQGYILKMVDSRMFWLDKTLKLKKPPEDLASLSAGPKGRIGSVFDWTVAGDYMLAYGSVKLSTDNRHHFGFFRALLQNPSSFDFLHEHAMGDYYLIGNKYLSELEGNGYFVLMDREAAIYEVPADGKGSIRRLDAFPEEYRRVRVLMTESTGPGSDEALYREIEGLVLPSGLYGQNGFLYLLTREPSKDGTGTLWYLHQIDPRSNQVLRKAKLPTSINHLTIVPTKDKWLVFERGAVRSSGRQDISSMLVIPIANIRSMAMPAICRRAG